MAKQRDYKAEYQARKERAAAAGYGSYNEYRKRARESVQALSAEEITAGMEAGEQHDLGPWIETPQSSRVSRFRYDHLQRQIQVQWTNNTNHGYVYEGMDYEDYRAFARVVSKGRHINTLTANKTYGLMTESQVNAPSNEKRMGIGGRQRT